MRKSEKKDFPNFAALDNLFDKDTIRVIVNFFDLTEEYNDFRRQDFGACELLWTNKDYQGNYLISRIIFFTFMFLRLMGLNKSRMTAYIIQTPFYRSRFWSLFLICKTDPENPTTSRKISGVIQAGSDIDLEQVLSEVKARAAAYSYHPLILPATLFLGHHETTSTMVAGILEGVAFVERMLLVELERQKDKSYIYDGGSSLLDLSERLHRYRMDLVELRRRRAFEDDVAKKLEEALGNENALLQQFARYNRWAKSNDGNIESLPDRIESQRNLVSMSPPNLRFPFFSKCGFCVKQL